MKKRFFPPIDAPTPWHALDGSLVEAVDPDGPTRLKRGVQRGGSARQMAFLMGRDKKPGGDRTDETLGAAQIIHPPSRSYDKEKQLAKTFLGGDHAATQLSDAHRMDTLTIPRAMPLLGGTSGLREATRAGSIQAHTHGADEDTSVRFRQDMEEFIPDTREGHDEAAHQTIELRKAALQAGISNFRIAHSGIDTLVPLGEHDDRVSRELIWDVLTARDAPFTVAARHLDAYVDTHVKNELRSGRLVRDTTGSAAARTIPSDISGGVPLPAQSGTRFTRDVYKTIVALELDGRDDPIVLERVGGWAMGVLAATGEHVASLKQDGLRALGKLTMGLLDTSAGVEGRVAQRADMDIRHTTLDESLGIAERPKYDFKDAMKNDEFRVALQALHDAALFDEPADLIVSNLSDILRREDPACSNDVAADLLVGAKDAAQVFQKRGRDRVYTMHTSHGVIDTPATLLSQSKLLTQSTRVVGERLNVADKHNQVVHASSRPLGVRDDASHSSSPIVVGNESGRAVRSPDMKLTRTKHA